MIEVIFGLVKGHEYKDVYENGEHLFTEVKTPNCGWKTVDVFPTCTKGCDTKCKLCQILFDEIDVEY